MQQQWNKFQKQFLTKAKVSTKKALFPLVFTSWEIDRTGIWFKLSIDEPYANPKAAPPLLQTNPAAPAMSLSSPI